MKYETWEKRRLVEYRKGDLVFKEHHRTCEICGMSVPDDINILYNHRKRCKQ
jgi:hypothetical protein